MIQRILLILLLLFAAAQFFRPDRSVPAHDPRTDLFAMTTASPDIQAWVKGACYDCHSYETDDPWYANVTPINWWLQDHINEGREALNFSRWDLYRGSEHAAESGEEMAEGEMPPKNYTWMHDHAQLTPAQHNAVMAWFNALPGVTNKHDAPITGDGRTAVPGNKGSGNEDMEEDD